VLTISAIEEIATSDNRFPTLHISQCRSTTVVIMSEESFKHLLGNICLLDRTNYMRKKNVRLDAQAAS